MKELPKLPLQEYIDQIYGLSYVIRYNCVPRIRDETVAEHSFYVAAIVLGLHEKYDFNLGKALQIAVAHDLVESETGDVTHKIKMDYKGVYDAVEEAEAKAIQKFPSPVQEGFALLNGDSIEATIVHFADTIQCTQYAKHEIALGNTGYMSQVFHSSNLRANQLEEKLVPHLRN